MTNCTDCSHIFAEGYIRGWLPLQPCVQIFVRVCVCVCMWGGGLFYDRMSPLGVHYTCTPTADYRLVMALLSFFVCACDTEPRWSSFGEWSDCISTVNGCQQFRTRVCLLNDEETAGCSGERQESNICDNRMCTGMLCKKKIWNAGLWMLGRELGK